MDTSLAFYACPRTLDLGCFGYIVAVLIGALFALLTPLYRLSFFLRISSPLVAADRAPIIILYGVAIPRVLVQSFR